LKGREVGGIGGTRREEGRRRRWRQEVETLAVGGERRSRSVAVRRGEGRGEREGLRGGLGRQYLK
jgi:hypothetical protein